MDTRLLTVRRRQKRRRPRFVRQETNAKLELRGLGWRRPRGKRSKQRLRNRGRPARPAIGHGAPRAVRGLLRDGRRPVRVASLKDLQALNPETDAAVIASAVGGKLRVRLLLAAAEKQIPVQNARR